MLNPFTKTVGERLISEPYHELLEEANEIEKDGIQGLGLRAVQFAHE